MDRQALRWIAILDNEDKDPETSLPLYSEAAKDRIFGRLKEWLKERKRLFPDEKPREGAGVVSMREWMNDPSSRAELEKMIRRISGEGPRAARAAPGAKTRDKAAEQKKQAEGSALHALVFDGEGLEESE